MDNKTLEQFVQKMYNLSFSPGEKSYTEAELKEIALETGMSESDWEASRREFKKQKNAGLQHIAHHNYSAAVEVLEKAKALNPFDSDLQFYLAKAYKGKAETSGSQADYTQAEKYAQAAVAGGSGEKAVYSLMRDINKGKNLFRSKRKKLLISILAVIGIILIIILAARISVKNSLIAKEEKVKEQWAQVENVYQRRADVIPALVKTVKAAADFEKELIRDVTQARSKVGSVNIKRDDLSQEKINAFAQQQDELSSALSRLLAVSENYPELKSLSNFRDLQAQIEGSENRISVERRRYNQKVSQYNAFIKKFPQSLFSFEEKGYFRADKGAEKVPEIDL